jgi:hypothetical protein
MLLTKVLRGYDEGQRDLRRTAKWRLTILIGAKERALKESRLVAAEDDVSRRIVAQLGWASRCQLGLPETLQWIQRNGRLMN